MPLASTDPPMTGRRTFLALCALALIACAGRAAPNSHGAPDQSVLSAEELAGSNQGNLLDAVRMLRPQWLTLRTTSPQGSPDATVIVYVDDQRLGPADLLRTLSIDGARSLRYYSPSAATVRFGPNHPDGVIQVVSAPHGS